jgi:hypothetical protein
MSVRCVALSLLLGACGEAAPAVTTPSGPIVEEVRPVVDPWAVRLDGEPRRMRFAESSGIELPVRIGEPRAGWNGMVVMIRREGIGVAGRQVLALADGRIPAGEVKGPVVPRIVEAIAPLLSDRAPVMLLADRRLRFDDFNYVVNSALRAGSRELSIAVRGPEDPGGTATGEMIGLTARWSGRVAELKGTRRELFAGGRTFALALMITNEALELGEIRYTGGLEKLARFKNEEGLEPVRGFARALAGRLEATEYLPYVVFGAEPEVPLERVVAALASVGGTVNCEGGPDERDKGACWFPLAILDGHAKSLWDLAVPAPGSLTVTLEERGARRRSDGSLVFDFAGDRCSVEREPGWVVAKLRANGEVRGAVRLIAEDGGRQRVTVEVPHVKLEVKDLAACAKFSAELTRHDEILEEDVGVKGFLEIECDLGDVMVEDRPYRAKVAGRVNFTPCG